VIGLQTNLPSITGKVSIDGYTQPGAVEAPDSSTPAQPQIVIDAQRVTRGIRIAGDGSELRGLVVQGADGGAGIFFLADGLQVDGNDNRITGNFIGTDETGLAAVPNLVGTTAAGDAAVPNGHEGVYVAGDDNAIGGPQDGQGNVVAGNGDEGVRVGARATVRSA
jgi:hypothetical protein